MNNNVDGRVAKWDNIKFVLMCFVVLGHFINYTDFQSNLLRWLWVSIYSFHMPAFLFLSGLLSKRTITEQRLEKVFAYLYLYFTMEIFQFIVFSIVNGTPSSFVFFSDAGAPWYALVLFWCYVATGCLKSLKSNYVFIFAVVLGILAGYSNLGDFLSGMRFFTLFPFFLAGYYIPTEKLLTVVENRCVKVCSIVFLLVVFFLCYMYRDQLFGVADFLKCRTTYNNTGMLSYGGLFRTCYY
ncbi:MAG: acyltransferase family protein, partial [Lachnospiraceae bacterium]|nr:acyltransferase family protein [Lachnospiraceae bacterium]